jgi:hypothetical protein
MMIGADKMIGADNGSNCSAKSPAGAYLKSAQNRRYWQGSPEGALSRRDESR